MNTDRPVFFDRPEYSLVWVWVPLVPKPECVVHTGGCQSLELHVQITSDSSQSVSDYSEYYLFELGNDTIHHLCSHTTSVHLCWEQGYYSQCKWYFEIWTSLFTSLSQYDFGFSSQHILIIECETEILFNNAAFNKPVLNPITPFSESSNDSDIKTSSILIESFPYFWTHSNEKQYSSSFARIL